MTREEAIAFFAEFYCGEHHIPRKGLKPCGNGWSVNHRGSLATFDFNTLTRLVFLAHDRCVRVEIMHGGPGSLKIGIWQRDRNGSSTQRHPTITEALETWREKHPLLEEKA